MFRGYLMLYSKTGSSFDMRWFLIGWIGLKVVTRCFRFLPLVLKAVHYLLVDVVCIVNVNHVQFSLSVGVWRPFGLKPERLNDTKRFTSVLKRWDRAEPQEMEKRGIICQRGVSGSWTVYMNTHLRTVNLPVLHTFMLNSGLEEDFPDPLTSVLLPEA